MNREEFTSELDCYNKALEISPVSSEYLIQKLFCLLPLKRSQKVVRIDPFNPNAYQLRGECLLELKDYKGMVADFKKVIQMDPMLVNASPHLRLAEVIHKYTF